MNVLTVKVRVAGMGGAPRPVPVDPAGPAQQVVDFLWDVLGEQLSHLGEGEKGPETLRPRLLHRGAQLALEDPLPGSVRDGDQVLLVMTPEKDVRAVDEAARRDSRMRSMEEEERLHQSRLRGQAARTASFWGEEQDPTHKFCRFQVVSRFTTPHPFEAEKLLVKLATDPAVKHVMKKHKFTVGLLAEMDPRDDRLAQKKEAEGACLLGYNENAGAAIYLRLRTDDEQNFRSYQGLVNTLLHELTHNLVGPHNDEFWGIFAEFKKEYILFHKQEGRSVSVQEDDSHHHGGPRPAEAAAANGNMRAITERTVSNQLRGELGNRALAQDERQAVARVVGNRAVGIPVTGQRIVIPTLGASQSAARREARDRFASAAEKRFQAPPQPAPPPPPAAVSPPPPPVVVQYLSSDQLELIRLLMNNIKLHPSEAKYQSVKTSNERVHKLLLSSSHAMEVLRDCGWVVQGEMLVFDPAKAPPKADVVSMVLAGGE